MFNEYGVPDRELADLTRDLSGKVKDFLSQVDDPLLMRGIGHYISTSITNDVCERILRVSIDRRRAKIVH